MMVDAVIFDVFGTLLQIRSRQNPFRQLLREGVLQGRPASPGDLRTLMTFNGGLSEAADFLGIRVSTAHLSSIRRALESELESLCLFGDVTPALDLLRSHGVKVAVFSNLAAPYCEAVRRLVPRMDAYGLSPEMGLMKPDPEMYRSVCRMLNVVPGQQLGAGSERVWMIGDSRKCDESGPCQIGIVGYHLDRSGPARFRGLLEFASVVIDQVLSTRPASERRANSHHEANWRRSKVY